MAEEKKTEFEQQESQKGLIGEFIEFLAENKKWWLLPMVIVMLFFGILLVTVKTGVLGSMYAVW